MNPLAVLLALLSAVTHAWRELQTKKAHDKQVFVWWFGLASLIMYFPLFLYFILQTGISAPGVKFIMLSGIVHCFYWYFLSKAYEKGDLSHVYPIMRSSPALTLLFGVFFLGEYVSLQGVLGIVATLCGVYLINSRRESAGAILAPFHSFKERSTQFALLTAVTVALYSMTDSVGVKHIHPVVFVYFITLFVMVFNTIYVFSLKPRALILKEWHAHKGMIVINGFLTMFSYLLILIALTFERVSYVSTLRQSSIVFGVFFGGHLLKEKNKALRLAGAIVILSGIVLISLAD